MIAPIAMDEFMSSQTMLEKKITFSLWAAPYAIQMVLRMAYVAQEVADTPSAVLSTHIVWICGIVITGPTTAAI